MDTNSSEFFHFGILPSVCIHSPQTDQYSHMYKPREECGCGSNEWTEEGCTMELGTYLGTPIYKDVHRCKACKEVRVADHIGVLENDENK